MDAYACLKVISGVVHTVASLNGVLSVLSYSRGDVGFGTLNLALCCLNHYNSYNLGKRSKELLDKYSDRKPNNLETIATTS